MRANLIRKPDRAGAGRPGTEARE